RGGRGRQRREAREGEGEAMAEAALADDQPARTDAEPTPEQAVAPRAADLPAPPEAEEPIVAVAPVAPVAQVTTPSTAQSAQPPAEPFELPVDDLRALAASAGLEWVNSDAERILVVQQAMANEPKPVHVPRQPRPRVVIDDGPLVLVETRKDLSQMKLPFEQQPPAQA
ncbi:MAG: ribonuclease E/G, partial [Burkholderiales bacterium]|nr:ribonuclease E/G [Burkholderiales bacterium]